MNESKKKEQSSELQSKTSNSLNHKKHKKVKKTWYEYLWLVSIAYLLLGMFNILFAWLGLICFITPILISVVTHSKKYCNTYCGRGKLFQLVGEKYKLSRNNPIPSWMRSKWFRYGFLTFFMTMFGLMCFTTYQVFRGAQSLREVITLLWVFKVPWSWSNPSEVTPWISQFAFGFYSVMLTSTILGFITMYLYRPRSWCTYCPMGTMTQLICQAKEVATKRSN